MIATRTVKSRPPCSREFDDLYLWRGGRFLMIYVLAVAGLGAASFVWLR